DKLANRADEAALLLGTSYDIYCWAKDSAQTDDCTPSGVTSACGKTDAPNYMVQSYVEARFSSTVNPPSTASGVSGGLVDMVRTWDSTVPVLIFVEAEARTETSMTITLQLDEPGTAYCRAYPTVDPGLQNLSDILAAPGGPFSFELISDNPMRPYSAFANRNFEITVSGLSREELYFVYCAAEDDELADGCPQRDVADDPSCSSNLATAVLVEDTGRYTLDLTSPVISVLDATSLSQDSLTISVNMDEAGTAWCAAVLDRQSAPTTNQIVAAGFRSIGPEAGIVNVTISNLVRDTEYDVYCFARDDGTKSASNNTLEVQFSKKNVIGYTEMLTTKTDAHVLYDSEGPLLLGTSPVHNAIQVGASVNITLTFNEDVQAGTGSVQLSAAGKSDIGVPAADISVINRVAEIPVSGP
ncbi:unnamed protein product, partial [Polarella glacialis]